MSRFFLDTNSAGHCIFRRRGVDERAKQARLTGAKLGIAMPVKAELLAGVEYSATREKNLVIVNRSLKLFRIWPFTADAARTYARLFAELRRAGRTIGAIELMVAAIALSLGNCTVVSADGDFDAGTGITGRELGALMAWAYRGDRHPVTPGVGA